MADTCCACTWLELSSKSLARLSLLADALAGCAGRPRRLPCAAGETFPGWPCKHNGEEVSAPTAALSPGVTVQKLRVCVQTTFAEQPHGESGDVCMFDAVWVLRPCGCLAVVPLCGLTLVPSCPLFFFWSCFAPKGELACGCLNAAICCFLKDF